MDPSISKKKRKRKKKKKKKTPNMGEGDEETRLLCMRYVRLIAAVGSTLLPLLLHAKPFNHLFLFANLLRQC